MPQPGPTAASIPGSDASVDEAAVGRLAPFRFSAYRRYWLGRVVSSAGSAVAPVALAFAIIRISGVPSALGWVLAASTVAQLLFMVVGGVVADRMTRTRVLVYSNLLAALSEGLFAVLVLSGVARLWQGIVAAFITGTASAFIGPANQGTLKTLVPRHLIKQATALQRSALNTTKIAGPAVAGVLVALIDPGWALAWNAASFVAAALIISRIRADFPPMKVRSFMQDVKHGWSEFWSRRWLWSVTLQGIVGVGVWLIAFQLFGPLYANRTLDGSKSWGIIAASFSAGLFIGSLTSVVWSPNRAGLAMSADYAAVGLFPLALALHGDVFVLMAAAALAGFCMDLAIVSWSTYRQLSIPDELQSRIESYNSLIQLLPVPIGYLGAGWAADHLGIGRVAAVLAVLGLAVAAIPLLSTEIRQLSIKHAVIEPQAAQPMRAAA